MGKELLLLYNLSLVDQEWCRATSEYWNLVFLGNRCCISIQWDWKGPNLGFSMCKHLCSTIHVLFLRFFAISHTYHPVDGVGEEWLVKFQFSTKFWLWKHYWLPFQKLELHIVCVSNIHISWEVELGKLRLRFQCDYFLHNRLIENYILHLLNALCKGGTKAFYDCLLVG